MGKADIAIEEKLGGPESFGCLVSRTVSQKC